MGMKKYRVRSDLKTLFRNLVRDDGAPAGTLVNEGGRKSVDTDSSEHMAALKALEALEQAGLLEVEEVDVTWMDKPGSGS